MRFFSKKVHQTGWWRLKIVWIHMTQAKSVCWKMANSKNVRVTMRASRLLSAISKCLCVNLECPILRQIMIASIFWGVRVDQIVIQGLISFNFFSECTFHSLFHFCRWTNSLPLLNRARELVSSVGYSRA